MQPFQIHSMKLALASLAAWSLLAATVGAGQPQQQTQQQAKSNFAASIPLVLTGGTVVDVTDWGHSAKDMQDAVVIVRDGRITDVVPRGAIPIPKGEMCIRDSCTVVPPLGLALALGQIHWAASTRQSYNGERRAAEGGHHEAGCKMPIGGVGFRGHGYV